mmetsp:Transcript_56520/g.123888  ORF Transcript_56520/g.123888 Transcript_56520/m.123888 type:complete len:362 (-) Transcript_56520:78-1163(-)
MAGLIASTSCASKLSWEKRRPVSAGECTAWDTLRENQAKLHSCRKAARAFAWEAVSHAETRAGIWKARDGTHRRSKPNDHHLARSTTIWTRPETQSVNSQAERSLAALHKVIDDRSGTGDWDTYMNQQCYLAPEFRQGMEWYRNLSDASFAEWLVDVYSHLIVDGVIDECVETIFSSRAVLQLPEEQTRDAVRREIMSGCCRRPRASLAVRRPRGTLNQLSSLRFHAFETGGVAMRSITGDASVRWQVHVAQRKGAPKEASSFPMAMHHFPNLKQQWSATKMLDCDENSPKRKRDRQERREQLTSKKDHLSVNPVTNESVIPYSIAAHRAFLRTTLERRPADATALPRNLDGYEPPTFKWP